MTRALGPELNGAITAAPLDTAVSAGPCSGPCALETVLWTIRQCSVLSLFGVAAIRSDNGTQEKHGICCLGSEVGYLFSFCLLSYCIREGYLKPKRWARRYSVFSGLGKNLLEKIMIYLEDKINSKLHELLFFNRGVTFLKLKAYSRIYFSDLSFMFKYQGALSYQLS